MRRVRYHRHGGPEVLTVEEAEVPEPGPGELLVHSEAIGVSLPAVRRVRDTGVPLPGVLGGEVAGEVAAVGPGVTGFAVGDRVVAVSFTDSYADFAVAPTTTASHIPDGVDCNRAAALLRGGQVALAALASAAPAGGDRPLGGASVLVTGAAGGVGQLAVQLARLRGADRVTAAVSSRRKADFLYGLGVDGVVTYGSPAWGSAPADVVLDGVGGEVLPRALEATAPWGRLVYYASGGGSVPAHVLLSGCRTVTGVSMRGFSTRHPELYAAHAGELWRHALDEPRPGHPGLHVRIHAELPLAEAARAHEIIEARANLGKVVLRP